MILYEHPFNERVRTYLRLEYLFRRFELLLQRDHPTDHHFCFSTIFEIVEVGGRADLKSDILKDLERHKQQFQSYRGNPSVAEAVLAFPRQALHAAVLGFEHPVTREELLFESEMPEDMQALLAVLSGK